jgi:putative transferase (TIGR04331 family)
LSKNSKTLILTPYNIKNYINNFKKEDLLGLGSWCENKDFDIKTIENYLDNSNFDRDEFYKNIYESKRDAVSILSIALNRIHNVNYSRRYWDIVLGPWLLRFVAMVYDKWLTVDFALKTNSVSGYVGIECKDLTCDKYRNSKIFINNTQGDIFNHMMYQDTLDFFKITCLSKIKIDIKMGENDKKIQNPAAKISFRLKRVLINFIVKISNKGGKYYISNAYLDKCSMILLSLRFGLSPPCPSFDTLDIGNVKNNNLRSHLEKELLKINDNNQFNTFLLSMVLKYAPCEYIEKYSDIQVLIKKSRLPKKPKVMYTASLHLSSDVFNFWSALNVEHGASLMLGQHGGMFGCAKNIPFETHEFDVCDKYVSWGWGKKIEKVIQTGMTISKIHRPFFKYFNYKNCKPSLLIVAPKYPKYFMLGISKDNTDLDWKNCFNEQLGLVRSLNRVKIDKIIYRSKSDYGSNVGHYKAFIDKTENIEFQSITDIKISTIVNKSRLVVVTYNATMILQLLSSNIPVIAIWNKENWSLRNEAEEFFNILQSVGILHYDYKSASRKINYIWSDVNSWWFSKEIQSAVSEFCSEFSGRTTCIQKSNIIKKSLHELAKNE